MAEVEDRRRNLGWFLPILAVLIAIVLGVAILVSDGFDLLLMVYTFLVVPLLSLLFAACLVFFALRKKRTPNVSVFLVLPAYWVITAAFFVGRSDIRTHARWLLSAKPLKASLLNQPLPANGEFRHMEWDGWGWAGIDTNVYLVFDPADSLESAAKNHLSGRFPGIPCAVARVRRLERNWYSVEYYTDARWNECT